MIKNRYNIAVIGAGYVGLDLAIAFSKKCEVVCYDISSDRIKELTKGIDINKQHNSRSILHKNLIFTNDKKIIKDFDTYIITVPTPINKLNYPDLRMLKDASKLIGKSIKKNSMIIFESTTFPGCTEEICIPIIEKNSKFKFKEDFKVGYSPERVNPGDKVNTLTSITKIIGANDQETIQKVKSLYKKICKEVHLVSSIKVAESAKVIENIQRDINIAFVNELSILFNKLKISTNEVLEAASTKWNFHYYKPGLVGGHCISVDPYYLSYKAKENKFNTKLILSGRQINESMGKYVAIQTIKLMSDNKVNLSAARVAVLGFTFKDNIPDIRNTKVLQLINELQKHKIIVKTFDSLASKNEAKKLKIKLYDFKDLKKFKYDAIILAVSHDIFLKKISFYNKFYKNKKMRLFIDIKNNYSVNELKKQKLKFFQL
jgi:UDP-N-acetyl-D-galactosamine dehydrogenase